MTATAAKSIAKMESDARATEAGWEVVTCKNGKVATLTCADERAAAEHLNRYRRQRVRELLTRGAN